MDHEFLGKKSLAQDKGGISFLVREIGYFFVLFDIFFLFLVCLTAGDGVPFRGLVAAYCAHIPVCILAPFLSGGLGL